MLKLSQRQYQYAFQIMKIVEYIQTNKGNYYQEVHRKHTQTHTNRY